MPTTLVFGASRGLGRAFTDQALRQGHRVLALVRQPEMAAELRTLEQDGKAWRERAPIGKEHLWWRATHRPLCDLTVITAMGLAARLHPTPSALRAVLQRLSTRAANPAIRQILSLSSTAKHPHRIVADAVSRCA